MARPVKSNALKLKENTLKGGKTESPALKVVPGKKRAEKAAAVAAPPEKKAAGKEKPKVSQRLLDTIERRKKAQAAQGNRPFGRPQGRRGRRPKALAEYVPNQQEEENYSYDSEYEGLEYDTGIQLKERSDDGGFSFERTEDFDEELNFDW